MLPFLTRGNEWNLLRHVAKKNHWHDATNQCNENALTHDKKHKFDATNYAESASCIVRSGVTVSNNKMSYEDKEMNCMHHLWK